MDQRCLCSALIQIVPWRDGVFFSPVIFVCFFVETQLLKGSPPADFGELFFFCCPIRGASRFRVCRCVPSPSESDLS